MNELNLKKIELKSFNKTIWSNISNTMKKYNMIEKNDKIALGFSGGKDSILLFHAFLRLKKILNFNFEIFPIFIFDTNCETSKIEIKNYINSYDYELIIKEINIGKILKEKNIKSPCSMCSRLRRGIIYSEMQKLKINKLALGHHLDDIIETYLMNLFFQGNKKIMQPCYISKEYNIKIIRPLSCVKEKNIISYMKKGNFKIFEKKCQYLLKRNNIRTKIKDIINTLDNSSKNNDIRSVIKKALDL